MTNFRLLGATLFLSAVAASAAQAAPFADALLMPPNPMVVTLNGTLQLHGGLVVLVLDQPIALRSADGRSVDVGSQSEVEVSGVMVSNKDFHPEHVSIDGTLSRGYRGEPILLTLQGRMRTGT